MTGMCALCSWDSGSASAQGKAFNQQFASLPAYPSSQPATTAAAANSTADPVLQQLVSALDDMQHDMAAEFRSHLVTFLTGLAQQQQQQQQASSNSSTSTALTVQPGHASSGAEDAHAHAPGANALSSVLVRPPHDVAYYPCRFDDCVYCAIRRIYVNALSKLKADVTRELARLSAAAASSSSSQLQGQQAGHTDGAHSGANLPA